MKVKLIDPPPTPRRAEIIQEVAALLTEQRIPTAVKDGVLLDVPVRRLFGPACRPSEWMKEEFGQLLGLRFSATNKKACGVLVAAWRWNFPAVGETVSVFLPPLGVALLRDLHRHVQTNPDPSSWWSAEHSVPDPPVHSDELPEA